MNDAIIGFGEIGHDLDFAGELPKLLPHMAEVRQKYFAAQTWLR